MSSAKPVADVSESRMEVNTHFGAQTIDPASVIRFPKGLAGFEDLHEYKLFHEEDKPSVFFLQSIEDPDVQFSVVNPDTYQVNYECVLTEQEAATLELDDPSDIAVLVTLASGGESDRGIHANFMGPIMLNTSKRIALQKHLNQVSGSVVIRAD
jgi:flagellar assembly factor FliW